MGDLIFEEPTRHHSFRFGPNTSAKIEVLVVPLQSRPALRQCQTPGAQRVSAVGHPRRDPAAPATAAANRSDRSPTSAADWRPSRVRRGDFVPSFTAGDDGHPRIVAAVVAGLVIAVAEQMRKGISAPGDMPDQNGPDDDAPEPNAGAELQRLVGLCLPAIFRSESRPQNTPATAPA